ncbi:hypothetical protein ACOIDT_29715, partial [Klebsiella pneumoniae]
AGTFYWGSHTYTLESASDVTLAIPGINASGVCTATGSGTSLTINGCFSFTDIYTIYVGKSASCKSFFNFFNDINSSLTSFGDFVGLTFSSGTGTDLDPPSPNSFCILS